MLKQADAQVLRRQARTIAPAQEGDPQLGPLTLLPGLWRSLPGRGWNMIALPFAAPSPSRLDYRLLLNQYDETLEFKLVDKAVPNRGIRRNGVTIQTDQFLATLDYEQMIEQIAAADFPASGMAGGPGLPIHHEAGLWLHMANEFEDGINLARLSAIPHGDSVLALGSAQENDGAPLIPDINGLPLGVNDDLGNPYLAPYQHFHQNLFQGLFDPTRPNDLLKAANAGVNIARTTTLTVDSEVQTGGIVNIPFVVKQANASAMKSTFWIQELAELDPQGQPRLRLQYSQVVLLDFFPRSDGAPGRIRWPHVSINTLEKAPPPAAENVRTGRGLFSGAPKS